MPVGIIRIVDGIDALRMNGIFDVQQNSVTGACAGRQADRGVDGNVVALVGVRRFLLVLVMAAAVAEAVQRAGSRIDKDARAGDDLARPAARRPGTLITSMRNSAVLGSLSGFSPEQPASSSG